jgi:hypothetical protein
VKTYHDVQATRRTLAVCSPFFESSDFSSSCRSLNETSLFTDRIGELLLTGKDANLVGNLRDPTVLQLNGMSRATDHVPFQVYHLPADHFENFGSWVTRTMSSNPVEAIYGLYDVVRDCTCDDWMSLRQLLV